MRVDDYIKKFYKKNSEKEHAIEVSKFANELFEALVALEAYNYLKKYQSCLKLASLLHDIGINIEDGTHHAKRGAECVLKEGIEGTSEEELKIISCLIRYHRGKKPKKKHEIYGSFERDMRKTIKILSSILQIADLLDFEHLSYVENLDIKLDGEKFVITTTPNISRLNGFTEFKIKKIELFEKVFQYTLEII